jgi:hypothetical protein
MTQAQAKAILRSLGFTMSVCDGEFRVAPMEGTTSQKEARACYTDDLDDAVGTARQEVARAMRDAACEAHRAARAAEQAADMELFQPMSDITIRPVHVGAYF